MCPAELLLRSVGDTAFWMAYYRALETERADALFRDACARRLAGERGERIYRHMRWAKSGESPMVVRTAVFDEMIADVVKRSGIDLVLNLAAGLDARPYRLPLPPTLLWVEADLPEIIDYKGKELEKEKAACQVERVGIDLRDRGERRLLLTGLNHRSARALIVTEGLLVYLAPEEVAALAGDLHSMAGFGFWLTDLGSPKVLQRSNRLWGKHLRTAGAPFRFGPAEGTDFFRPYGWREAESRWLLPEARRLKRPLPMDWLIRFWAIVMPRCTARVMKQWRSGVVLLERGDAA
ncbi:MAG TPA: SAM-dependent methyltransferase [Candidatus Acidoferrales bacterium]|nr:SAM-dependent methyltransferase [Candidatus Acidoferrales bacterium]